jgi:hypothetical protein
MHTGTATLKLRIAISGPEETRYEATALERGEAANICRLPSSENVVIASEGNDPQSLTAP